MILSQFKDPAYHMCLAAAVVASWSLMQEVGRFEPFYCNDKYSVRTFRENWIIFLPFWWKNTEKFLAFGNRCYNMFHSFYGFDKFGLNFLKPRNREKPCLEQFQRNLWFERPQLMLNNTDTEKDISFTYVRCFDWQTFVFPIVVTAH